MLKIPNTRYYFSVFYIHGFFFFFFFNICYYVQVHITQGDLVGRAVIISWVTPLLRHPDYVVYWAAEGKHKRKRKAHSSITNYKYYNYASGYIHHATVKHLQVKH
jgi:hypothetical protein